MACPGKAISENLFEHFKQQDKIQNSGQGCDWKRPGENSEIWRPDGELLRLFATGEGKLPFHTQGNNLCWKSSIILFVTQEGQDIIHSMFDPPHHSLEVVSSMRLMLDEEPAYILIDDWLA